MSSVKTSKNQVTARAALMIVGMGKHYANVASLTIAGVSRTPAEITASLQTLVNLRQAVNDARAVLKSKVVAEHAEAPALLNLMSEVASVVKGTFGNSPDILADFGLTPKKARTPLTVEQKATAAAKRKATRAARHTMGPKQRSKVKGDVAGVVVTPVVTTTIPPATPAPSPSGTATAPAAASSATGGAPVQGATATSPASHA